MLHGPPFLFLRIRESQQREVLHGPGEEVPADEDGADDEGPRELPELPGHEATHPTLKLWHLRHPRPQGPGVPCLCSGELVAGLAVGQREESPSPQDSGMVPHFRTGDPF